MLAEDKQILWRVSAVAMGLALPAVLIGRGVMFGLLFFGVVAGLLATKGDSLRASMALLQRSWVALLVMAFLGFAAIGAAVGADPVRAADKWLQLAFFALASGLTFLTLREMSGRHVELLLKTLAIGTMLAAGLGVLDVLLGDARLSAALHGADKALTPYRLNFLSAALVVLAPFVWVRLWVKSREGEPFAQRIALPAAAFLLLAIVLCGGRSGWVAMLVSGPLLVWLGGKYHGVVPHAKHWLVLVGTLVLGLGLYAYAHGWDFMWGRASIVGEAGVGRGMLSGRGEVWASAWEGIVAMPWWGWLVGVGVSNFRVLPTSIDLHPHNWVLQLWLETGLLGLGVFCALCGALLWRFWQFAKGQVFGVAALCSLVAFLVCGLASTSIVNAWWLTFFAFSALLGWRVGWGGDDVRTRRKGRMVSGTSVAMVPPGAVPVGKKPVKKAKG